MPIATNENLSKLWSVYRDFENTDFIVGVDSFEDIQIDDTGSNNFWYFRNNKKGLIKRFILQQSNQIEKTCTVTLIKKSNDKFTPRFDFYIWNTTKKACENLNKENPDQNLIKARVSLETCHDNFLTLISFIKGLQDIEFDSHSYSVIDSTRKEIFDNISKKVALDSFVEAYGTEITDQDVALLQGRRSKMEIFQRLLTDIRYFETEKAKLGVNKRTEDVWQNFFENNSWIFGYGLQLLACENLDDKKLEQVVAGTDIIDGSGKRIDALLKTKGSISKILFCEIKNHYPNLLITPYDRPGVYVPGKELSGAVAQIQKTIHKVTLRLTENYHKPTKQDGTPTGEEILFVKPRGVIVIGRLDDFKTDTGINYEKLSSFELYRQQINGIEIITYDELYERARFIVQS